MRTLKPRLKLMCTTQEEESRKHFEPLNDTRRCLRHPSFRLGSGAVRPSNGAAPRPLPSVPSRREPTLSADCTGAMICARTQTTKPRILAFGLVILSCLHCSALSESDITIVDESDIGQSQYYTTARLRSHGNQSLGHAPESISPGPEGDLMQTRDSLVRATGGARGAWRPSGTAPRPLPRGAWRPSGTAPRLTARNAIAHHCD